VTRYQILVQTGSGEVFQNREKYLLDLENNGSSLFLVLGLRGKGSDNFTFFPLFSNAMHAGAQKHSKGLALSS
jgi:hypothetical protein